jgi:hypothetical protein
LVEKKNFVVPLFGNFAKKGLFGLFSAKIGPFATSSIYSESAQRILSENVQFFDLWKFVEILGKSWDSIFFFIQEDFFSEERNATWSYLALHGVTFGVT